METLKIQRQQRYTTHHNLFWSVFFLCCAVVFGIGGIVFWSHHHTQRQEYIATHTTLTDMQKTGLTQEEARDIVNVLSGIDTGRLSPHLQELYQGAKKMIQAYTLGLSQEVASIRTGFLLAQSARDMIENAGLLAPSAPIYEDIQAMHVQSQRLVSTLQIKLCYAGLTQAIQIIASMQDFFQRYQKTLQQLIITLTHKHTNTNDPELKQCLLTILQRLGENKKAFDAYQKKLERTDQSLHQEYSQKVRDPQLCLMTETLSIDLPFSGHVPKSLYAFQKEHQNLLLALQTDDTANIMEYCQPQDKGTSEAQQDMEQMMNDMEQMQQQKEQRKKEQPSEQKNHHQLNEYEQKAVEAIEQKGNTYYRDMQHKKQQGESSFDALQRLFRTFDAYQQDFIDYDQMIDTKTQGY